MHENRVYAIINKLSFESVINNIDLNLFINKILETNLSTVRYSLDGSKFIIKCDNITDLNYLRQRAQEENIVYTEYTHSQILAIVNSLEWQPQSIIN